MSNEETAGAPGPWQHGYGEPSLGPGVPPEVPPAVAKHRVALREELLRKTIEDDHAEALRITAEDVAAHMTHVFPARLRLSEQLAQRPELLPDLVGPVSDPLLDIVNAAEERAILREYMATSDQLPADDEDQEDEGPDGASIEDERRWDAAEEEYRGGYTVNEYLSRVTPPTIAMHEPTRCERLAPGVGPDGGWGQCLELAARYVADDGYYCEPHAQQAENE